MLAQGYPTKSIRIIVPVAPGGNVDIVARTLAAELTKSLGQTVIVENRPSAASLIGTQQVAKAAPDGYTLLWGSTNTLCMGTALYATAPPTNDYAAITPVIIFHNVLVLHPGVRANTVAELVDLAKARPDTLRFASSGEGSTNHLTAALFQMLTKTRTVHVPYKGGGPALNAVVSGETQLSFPSPIPVAPHVKSGRVRALGFTGDTRVSLLPDVPTIAEAGLPGFKFDAGWHAWFAPARTPPAVISRVYAEVKKALEAPKLREAFIAGGYEPKGDPPVEFQKTFRADIKHYAAIVKAAKIEAQ